MIGEVLVFLRDHLNASLDAGSGRTPGDAGEDIVVFVDGEKMDPISFKLGAVSALLINVEEENTLRPGDPFTRVGPDGVARSVHPDIRLNLYVLFVARFKQYERGLGYLSRVIEHFQRNRRFDAESAPGLDERVGELLLDLVTLPLAEQNELWNSLRTTYHPSVLYRVRMVVFRDEDALAIPEMAAPVLKTVP